MQAIGTYSPERNSFLPQEGYQAVTRASVLSASLQKSTDISLLTADGDKVTISANSAFQAGFASYDFRGRLNGHEATLQGRSLNISASSSFAISVEGDLSKEELDDIKKLVGNIEKLGNDFFSRPLEDSLSQALSVGDDLDSIVSFDARLSFSQQVSLAQEVKQESQAPSATLPSNTASSSNVAPASTPGTASALSSKDVQSFVNTLLKEAQGSQVDPEKVADQLPKFLTKLFHKLAKEFDFDAPKQRLADHVHKKISEGLKDQAEQLPTQAAA